MGKRIFIIRTIIISIVTIMTVGLFESYGQEYKVIDGLKARINNTDDKDLAKLYNELGWEYRIAIPDSTLFYCRKASTIALENNQLGELSKSMNFIGIALSYKGEYKESFQYYERGVDISIKAGDSLQLGHSYNNLGRLFYAQADIVKSYDYFFKALNIFKKYNDLSGIAYCYQSLVLVYEAQNNYGKALDMAQKALDIRVDANNKRGQISTQQDIARILIKLDRTREALDHLIDAKTIAEGLGDKISQAEINLGISEVYYEKRQFDKALEFCNSALASIKPQSNQNLWVGINLQLGQIFYALDEDTKSKVHLFEVVSQSITSGRIEPLKEAYLYLSMIAEKNQINNKALDYYKSHSAIKDSIYSTDIARTIERMEARIEIENTMRENQLLKAGEERNQLFIEKEKTKNLALTIIVILAVIALILLLVYLNQKIKHEKILREQKIHIEEQNQKINEQYSKLEKRNLELSDLNLEKDNLMNIVAHDLKSPFNNLKGLCQLVELTGSLTSEQQNYIKIMKEVSEKGANLTRDILDVNAFNSEDEQLKYTKVQAYEFLNEKANSFKSEADLKHISIQVEGTDKSATFLSEESYLSRILDNLLSNAIKYSPEESKIILKASIVNEQTTLNIIDQGPGFSEDDKKHVFKKFKRLSARPTGGESSNGLGLAIVKTLVSRMGGKIELISENGNGSEFVITLPKNPSSKLIEKNQQQVSPSKSAT